MKLAVLAAILGALVSAAQASQTSDSARLAAAQTSPPSSDSIAEAYDQFLQSRRLELDNKIEEAIAGYRRAMALDPTAAEIPAELSALYLRHNRAPEAMAAAEQALKMAPGNREAHRVLGTVYAAMADSSRLNAQKSSRPGTKPDENTTKAIQHLEAALAHAVHADPNVRATLSRLYLRAGRHEEAIPLLTDLVREEPGWQDGSMLLVEALAGAGHADDAITYLEQAAPADPRLSSTLAEFYERARRWRDAANAYAKALERAPRSVDLRTRYASALLNGGGREGAAKARDALNEALAIRPADSHVLYLLSQAQRRLGDLDGAETTARRVIAQDARNLWGYHALAEALEQRRRYQAVIDGLSPAIVEFRARPTAGFELGLLLPHLGFAYRELGAHDKAIAAFEEAHRLSPDDSAVTGYLIEANLVAKRYSKAIDLAREARAKHPDDLRLARLEATALRQDGKAEQGVALLQDEVKKHADDPTAYVALGRLYVDADRVAQAVTLLQDAQARFPSDTSIAFELGAVFDKQKRFGDAEAAFRSVLERDPENAPALNYLGYMLAERGERLDESVAYVMKALQIEPENGSYLDSLGWAYFKADKLDLAEDNLKRAADQLQKNSVVQDHYGELLFKLGRYGDAIAAWTRALNGDGEEITRAEIDRKIRAARQKLEKE